MHIKEKFNALLLLISTAVLILLYPLLLIIVLFFLVYRYLVTKIAERDPGFCRVITGMDAFYSGRDPCTKPIVVVLPFYVCTTKVDKHEVMRVFTERILKPKDNDGKVFYPEMTQKIVRKFGYNFWYKNDNFSLENHIKYINEDNPDTPLTRLELQNLINTKLSKAPFDPNSSPWEILIIRNFIDSEDPNAKSAILLRLHHGLFDGYSAISFVQRLAVNPWTVGGVPKVPKITPWQKILIHVNLLLTGPYHFLRFLLFSNERNKWTETLSREYKGRVNFHDSKLIPLKTLKAIKNHYNVSLTSVLYTVLAEALRKTMEKQENNSDKICMTTTIYMPGRPEGLTNQWASAKIECGLQNDGLEKTLHCIEKQFRSLRHSLLPMTVWNSFKLTGLLPVQLHPPLNPPLPSTLLVTNVPGSAQPMDMLGYDVSEFGYGGTPVPGFAFFAVILSYAGFLRFVTAGDESVLPTKKDAVQLVNTIEEIVNQWQSEVEKSERKD